MRSRKSCNITSCDLHSEVLNWLMQAKLLKDHGWKCTAAVVLNIVLRAAARSISVSAACRDLSESPSDQAVMNALEDGLPKTLSVLECRLNEALTGELPRRMKRRQWQVAIDWHLVPYYGQPHQSRNEIYYGKPRQGTKQFHAYASACIVDHGRRYTLALTWIRRHEPTVVVLSRLVSQIRRIGLIIKRILLDRAFFNVPVVEFLQQENLPFLMPVMFRGRRPKKRRKATGLRLIRQQRAGWYSQHHEEQKQTGHGVGVCRIPPASEPQRWQAGEAEAVVRRLAREGLSQRDSPAVPKAIRHRNELSSNATSPNLHMHAKSTPAIALCRRSTDSSQLLGLDSSHTSVRPQRRQPDASPGPPAFQTDVGLDRSRNRRPIP